MGKAPYKKKGFHPKKKGNVAVETEKKLKLYEQIPESSQISSFSQLPLSDKTAKGLKLCKYATPTEIQRECVAFCLRGADVLGAAKTGSGKTLAFVIPILECLWRKQWTLLDGLGALVISPTRELAYQTFQVIRNVGQKHDFSAALLIGGTDLEYERKRLGNINIVICTPGRLLQHMDENPDFNCLNLQILVIDEADRILDMGFSRQMNSIIENLPEGRQTLLFSATQTKSVKDLARLSLVDPIYVSVHENATHSTPDHLTQSYVICCDNDKMNMLWSFLKNHSRSKVLVFLSSCKQVRFVVDAFKLLQPGISLIALHGGLNQTKRMISYNHFCDSKHAALVATDIAARGLDFPGVDWVLQLDCPSDAEEYIHRSGRTARYNAKGEALLVLTPHQAPPMLQRLKNKKIPLSEIQINPKKLMNIHSKLGTLCASDTKIKHFAQMYFLSHYRAVFCMRDKEVFDVNSIDPDSFAKSLGLPFAPRVKFLKNQGGKEGKESELKQEGNKDDIELTFGVDNNADDDLFTVSQKKSQYVNEEIFEENEPSSSGKVAMDGGKKPVSRIAAAKKLLKNKRFKPEKKVFKEEQSDSEEEDASKEVGYNFDEAKKNLEVQDKEDRMRYAEMKKVKKLKKKVKKQRIAEFESDQEEGDEFEVTLGNPEDHSEQDDDEKVDVGEKTPSPLPPPVKRKKKKHSEDSKDDAESLAKRMLGLE